MNALLEGLKHTYLITQIFHVEFYYKPEVATVHALNKNESRTDYRLSTAHEN